MINYLVSRQILVGSLRVNIEQLPLTHHMPIPLVVSNYHASWHPAEGFEIATKLSLAITNRKQKNEISYVSASRQSSRGAASIPGYYNARITRQMLHRTLSDDVADICFYQVIIAK